MVVNSPKGVANKMMKNLGPNAITQTQQYWKSLGIELDEERAEEIARAYLELIDLIKTKETQKRVVGHEAA